MKTLSLSVFIPSMVLCAAVLAPAHAQSEVWVCMNGDGTREYKNTGETKGCKRVDMQGISMIPSPYKKPTVQTASFNRAGVQPQARPSPSDFPHVDSSTQKARDNDRMQILTEEMRSKNASWLR